MINIGLLVVFAILGIGLGVGYNFLVIKKYPEEKRKAGYVAAVIVFLIAVVALFSIISVKKYIDSAVPAKANELVETIKKEHSNLSFVRNGLDLKGINNDISKLNNTVADIKKVLPSHTDLGLSKRLYDFAADLILKEVQKKMMIINYTGKAVNSLADENNVLTISSIVNSLVRTLMKIANVVLLVLALIFIIILVVYIIVSLTTAMKEKRPEAVN